MRVALVHQDFDLRGSLGQERVLLARGLVQLGVDVHVYADAARETTVVPGAVLHLVEHDRHGTGRLGLALGTLSFARAATARLRADRAGYDIVDVASTAAWDLDVLRCHAVTLAEQRRWPERGGRTHRAARLRARLAPLLRPNVAVDRAIEWRQLRPGRVRRIAAATSEVRDDLVAFRGVPADVIDVVPLAIDTDRFAAPLPGFRDSQGIDGQSLLAFVGHDFERKGLGEALEVVAALGGRAHLVVLGDGPRSHYERMVSRAGIGDRVHFIHGRAPEEILAEADAFFLPTREDVWGMAIIEAMAAGVPVITTAIAGASREVRAAGAGIVVDRPDTRSLRDAVASVLGDAGARKAMGERGRRAAERFGVRANAVRMLELYERALGRTP